MSILARQPQATPNNPALSPHPTPPDGPSTRGQRGVSHATTPRLLLLRERYGALANDPGSGAGLRTYARELIAEVTDELRERTRRSHLVRGVR